MDKTIWKSTGKWPYILGNILVKVKIVFLLDCLLVLSLLKYKGIRVSLNPKKMRIPNKRTHLNSSIDDQYKSQLDSSIYTF